MSRWQRYWFAEGGRTALAIVRAGVAMSVLWTLYRLATLSTVHIPAPAAIYRPVGVWMLFGHWVPPVIVVDAVWAVAVASTAAMLLGLTTRAATAISFVTAGALAAASYSGSPAWSHQYNVVFLAQAALLGARAGDTLSLDAWLRRRRGLPALDVPRGYQWSLRLVQLAVALMFAGAAFHKMLHAHFTLRWALSDNLRHQLLVRFDLTGLPRTALADWLIDDVWRYRTAAALNLISQAAPILACVFVRRPWLRALAGGFFLLETIALGFVVDLWNLQWLPLFAVFVDWERLLAWRGIATPLPPTPDGWAPPRGPRGYVVALFAYEALTAIVPTVDQRLNTYPFTSFPMFSTVRARAPYAEHHGYALPGDAFDVLSDRPLDVAAQRWVNYMNRRLYQETDPRKYRNRLGVVLADIQRRFERFGIRGLRHSLALYEAAPYPAPARLDRRPIAVMGELGVDGAFRSALGAITDDAVTMGTAGLDPAAATLIAFTGDDLAARPLTATRDGARFATGPVDGDPLYVAARIGDATWLIAARRAWRWE